jgi:hypothetical protein
MTFNGLISSMEAQGLKAPFSRGEIQSWIDNLSREQQIELYNDSLQVVEKLIARRIERQFNELVTSTILEALHIPYAK